MELGTGTSAPLPSYNITVKEEVLRTCSSFAHTITCTLQRAQPGVNSAIVVHSGRMGAVTMLSKSAPLLGAPATLCQRHHLGCILFLI